MSLKHETQSDQAFALLHHSGIARLSEFAAQGITGATIGRLVQKGLVNRISRGLYQLPDAPLDTHHSLAEASKRVPKGVVCLVSALAFHELTDALPARIWMAIEPKDRKPIARDLPLQFVRFGPNVFGAGIEEHKIEGVAVRIYNPAKTVVDLFRYRQRTALRYGHSRGPDVAIEGLRQALRTRKATPAAIASYAHDAGAWKAVEPYLEALTNA